MTSWMRMIACGVAVQVLIAADATAGLTGGRGSGGGRSAPRPGGGAAARPAQRPSSPNLGGSRPAARPNVSRPSISQPAVSRPAIDRPSGPSSRPGAPSVTRPSIDRPSGGLKPSPQRPSTGIASRPTQRPNIERPNIERPNIERPNFERPAIQPPASRPSTRPETRPSTRPSLPNLGGGEGTNRPGISRPDRPGDAGRPGINRPEITRPGARPSPGDVGDFLGLDRPVTLPGEIATRPSLPRPERPGDGSRPGIDRPNIDRPNIDRPNIDRPGRPGGTGRPGIDRPSIGDINLGNQIINNRPAWVNINNNQIINIHNRWNNQVGGLHNWHIRHPARVARWGTWGSNVRLHWRRHHHWFGPNWWFTHPHGFAGWHFHFHFHQYPWRHWWTVPTFAACVNWFTWTAPPAVWSQPIFYDYGEGGNVVHQNNAVYVNGEQVATGDEFAQSAAVLATVPPPSDEEEAAQAEWLPLGTFAVATDEKDVDPSRVIQLALSREGIISGTLFNVETDQAQAVQGQVDKETQRVAFRIGESEDIVVETGLFNLTQDEAPVLVHFGPERTETYLLVRLEEPEEEAGE